MQNKIKHAKGFYIPDNLNLFYSLIYHSLIHKKHISEDYLKEFLNLSDRLNLDIKACDLNDICLLDILISYMHKHKYDIVEPHDISVFFNEILINKSVFIPVSKKRNQYKTYLSLRSSLKKIAVKVLKILKFA